MFQQYELPYSYDALDPSIDALTVEIFDARGESVYTLQAWGEDLP